MTLVFVTLHGNFGCSHYTRMSSTFASIPHKTSVIKTMAFKSLKDIVIFFPAILLKIVHYYRRSFYGWISFLCNGPGLCFVLPQILKGLKTWKYVKEHYSILKTPILRLQFWVLWARGWKKFDSSSHGPGVELLQWLSIVFMIIVHLALYIVQLLKNGRTSANICEPNLTWGRITLHRSTQILWTHHTRGKSCIFVLLDTYTIQMHPCNMNIITIILRKNGLNLN